MRHVDLPGESWRRARARIPHEVVAAIALPEHLRVVVRMRDGAGIAALCWRATVGRGQPLAAFVALRAASPHAPEVPVW